jgi:hypothetical protein
MRVLRNCESCTFKHIGLIDHHGKNLSPHVERKVT